MTPKAKARRERAFHHLRLWVKADPMPYHNRETDCLNATFDQWIDQLCAFAEAEVRRIGGKLVRKRYDKT